VQINDKHYQWQTYQKGAVGRMKIDEAFLKIIDELEGQLSVEKNGSEIISAVKDAYTIGASIEQATFKFVHGLFNHFGLVILLPDNKMLKEEFSAIIAKELDEQFSHKAVSVTVSHFPASYKVQAAGREINLFYLGEQSRERIEKIKTGFAVANTAIHFTEEEIKKALKDNPESFSPNVILRPVFQEMILPNIAFIGGGGEIAYWLELKKVFEAANAFFPLLILRNSFTVINKKTAEKIAALNLNANDIFKSEKEILEELVKKESGIQLDLIEEKELLKQVYETIKTASAKVDTTLNAHVHSLATRSLSKLETLEKKMLKAEKKKFEVQQRQIQKLKTALTPGGNLQERVDNILPYYAVYGNSILEILYKHSDGLAQQFTLLKEV
jgi:bacillithiol synthase